MKLSIVVKRLRDAVPELERRVDGVLEFADVDLTRKFSMPCAFVVPDRETVTDTTYISEYMATCETTFSVYVYANTRGRETVEGYDVADAVKGLLVKALAGWRVDGVGIEYEGFEVVEINRERIALKVDFSYTYVLRNEETAEAPVYSEFERIHVDYPDRADYGDYVPSSDIQLKEV